MQPYGQPPSPYGQPPSPYQGAPYRQGPDPGPPPPGCLMPILWLVSTLVVTLICGAVVGIAASGSETDGVNATTFAAMPFGFVWSGLLSAGIIHLAMKKAGTGVRVGGPLGCGCIGAIVFVGLVVVFFTSIFPAL